MKPKSRHIIAVGLLAATAFVSLFALVSRDSFTNNVKNGNHIALAFVDLAAQKGQEYYYLAPWEWFCETIDDCYWRAPGGNAIDSIDLRPLPAQAKAGIAEGYGFFSYAQQEVILNSIYLGDSLDGILSAQQKARVRTALNITGPMQSDTVVDVLWDVLTVHADPTGQTASKPIQGRLNKNVNLFLGGEIIKSEPFGDSHRQRAVAVFQADYTRNKQDGVAQDKLQRWTGDTMKKLYGRMDDDLAREILPDAHKDDGWRRPETTIGDTFVEASDTTLSSHTATGPNGGFSWSENTNGHTVLGSTDNVHSDVGGNSNNSRADTDLSTDDHYAQGDVTVVQGSGRRYFGPAVRYSASAETFYYFRIHQQGSSWSNNIRKNVNGTESDVATGNTTNYDSTQVLAYLEFDGSSYIAKVDGGNVYTGTDTSITGNLRTGIASRGTDTSALLDNFEAADLNATPADPTSPTQLKTDDATAISNEGYTEETSVTLKASVTDADTTETLSLFFELVANADSFTSEATPTVGGSCASGTAYASCASKMWYITSSSGDYSSTAFTATSTVATLTDATGYKWQVKACDDDSACSSWVAFNATTPNVTIDTTNPTAPGTPSATTPTTDTTPTWTWDASTDGGSGLHSSTPYWVEWSTDANFSSGVSSSTVATASFTHSTELADNTWYARIRALDAVSNESSYSSSSTVVVDTTVPTTPGTPSTESATTDTTPTWTWTASTDSGAGLHATEAYIAEWSTDSSFASGVSSSTAATATFTHSTELTDETTWYFRVRAQDAVSNESSYSSNASIAIDTTPPPGPGPSTAGGSAGAGTRYLQDQGYLLLPPAPLPPPEPPPSPTPSPPPTPPSIIERIIPPIFRPAPPPAPAPEPISPEEVPQAPPLVFQGLWQLLPEEPIRQFVLAPLPSEIRQLSQKFPELGETFEQIGVSKITDLQKLRSTSLTIPGFTETAGVPRGAPLAQLLEEEKEDVPCDVVFARAGGRMIDFSIVLSVTEQGQAKQKIQTLANQPLQLILRPCKPGMSVKGYLVFKSKTPQANSLDIPANSLFASAMLARPIFAQAQTEPIAAEEALVLLEFAYEDFDGDGLYTADIQTPAVDGEYELITTIEYEDPEKGIRALRLITVVDPEGYIYERSAGKEIRVPGAIASLYWWNGQSGKYELWPAKDYQQENPQVTDITGRYSFLAPGGSYYLSVEAPGYLAYQGKVFQVAEGSPVHTNIELKPTNWWWSVFDWRTLLLVGVSALLLLNFWRDRIVKAKLKNQNAK